MHHRSFFHSESFHANEVTVSQSHSLIFSQFTLHDVGVYYRQFFISREWDSGVVCTALLETSQLNIFHRLSPTQHMSSTIG